MKKRGVFLFVSACTLIPVVEALLVLLETLWQMDYLDNKEPINMLSKLNILSNLAL